MEPLSPRQKWKAITVATVLLVPAYWALLGALVSSASDDRATTDAPAVGAALAFALAIVPFVFIVLAFMSAQPRPSTAVLRAMALAVVIGIPASAFAGDAVTGIVAGIGAGGIAALRGDPPDNWRARATGVAVAAAYTFVLLRTAGPLVLLSAPVFPLTAIGIADGLSERREARALV